MFYGGPFKAQDFRGVFLFLFFNLLVSSLKYLQYTPHLRSILIFTASLFESQNLVSFLFTSSVKVQIVGFFLLFVNEMRQITHLGELVS